MIDVATRAQRAVHVPASRVAHARRSGSRDSTQGSGACWKVAARKSWLLFLRSRGFEVCDQSNPKHQIVYGRYGLKGVKFVHPSPIVKPRRRPAPRAVGPATPPPAAKAG